MYELSRRDRSAPIVRQAAAAAIAGSSSPADQAAAIHKWIKARVRFVEDADLAAAFTNDDDAEVLIPPADLLAMPQPQGDCDDYSMLAAAMLEAAGIPAAFITVAADPTTPDYSHVYVAAIIDGRPIALDASHGPNLGWAARPTGKRRTWRQETTMQQPRLGRLGFNWDAFGKIASTGISTAGQILIPRYAVPQLNPGQYMQNGQGVMYQQPAGSAAAIGLPTVGAGGNSMLWIAGGLAAVLIVGMLAKK